MRERRAINEYRRRPGRRGDPSQRNLIVAISLFAIAVVAIAALLVASREDDGIGSIQRSNISSPTPATGGVSNLDVGLTATAREREPATATRPVESITAVASESAAATSAAGINANATADAESTENASGAEQTTEAELPTATVESVAEEPTASDEPSSGDFGPLPPAQVVSGGVERDLRLSYTMDDSVSTPDTATVYQLLFFDPTEDSVATLASGLSVSGEIQDMGGGNFQVVGDTGELYVAPNVVQYVSNISTNDPLEDNDTVIANATDWLAATGLVDGNIGPGSIIGRDDDAGIAIVLFKPASPAPLLAFYPSAAVMIGAGGIVIEANVRWPSDYLLADYELRSLDAIWNQALAGEGSVEADLSGVPGNGPVNADLMVTSAWIAWSYAEGLGEAYLVPLVAFSGEATVNGSDTTFPVTVYVQAVENQMRPQG